VKRFEDHLWQELLKNHSETVAHFTVAESPNRHRHARAVLGVGLGMGAGATALAIALTATTAPPAFAVERHPNGTVTVVIRSAKGIAGANAKLQQLGIKARVMQSAPEGCHKAVPGGTTATASTGVTWTIPAQSPIAGSSATGRQSLVLTPGTTAGTTPSDPTGTGSRSAFGGSGGQSWICPATGDVTAGGGTA
jgi:hypothetical protein